MANVGRGPDGYVLTGRGVEFPPSFMPATGGTYYSLTPYIVGQVGDTHAQYTGATALQDAIDQAVIDGASVNNQKNIYIKPGNYSFGADVAVADGINLIGLSEKNYNAGLNNNGGDRQGYNASVQIGNNIAFSGKNSMQYIIINGTCTITGNLFSMLGCLIQGYTLISAAANINATFTMCGFKGIQVAAVGSVYILAQDCSIPADDGTGYCYLLQSAATFDIINCCVTGFAYFNVVGSTVNVLGGQYLARSINAVATININNAIVTDLTFLDNSTGAILTVTNCFDNINNNVVNTSLNTVQKIGLICNGIDGVTVTGSAVLVDGTTGQLGTVVSSERYKENIKSIEEDISILNLRPVEFNYIKDESKNKQYGLIAEEVEKEFPYLCLYDIDNLPKTVKYHEIPVLLLKEVQRLNDRIKVLESPR